MIENFISILKNSPRNNVFNPWFHTDYENDISIDSYKIRQNQLMAYFKERQKTAKYLLIAEALGYQGGHFTGIAMTSERILSDNLKHKGIYSKDVFSSIKFKRTSKPEIKKDGFTEPTATILWGALNDMNLNTKEFVNWNAFAWHPYNPHKGFLSNRTPTDKELEVSKDILIELLKIFNFKRVIAIGEKSYSILNDLNIDSEKVRHPANGGAGKFRTQLKDILLQN
jgi:uracil-DNA glycosylase